MSKVDWVGKAVTIVLVAFIGLLTIISIVGPL